jgi:Zn-dependent peptidase ImmA (M78 family)
MTTNTELGQRLARRREEFGISPEKVAEWASLPAERVQVIEETGQMEPWELHQLGRALAVSSGTIFQGLERSPKRSVARFRAAVAHAQPPSNLRLLAVGAEIGRILGSLVEMMSMSLKIESLRRPVALSDTEPMWKHGYRLGEAARSKSGLAQGPIPDLERTLMILGVHVGRAKFSSEDLDAASLWEIGSVPVILLNQMSPRVKYLLSRRAILAHELCHLLHDAGEADLTTQVSWAKGNLEDSVEQRARGFAPAFIAPRDSVRHWARTVLKRTSARNLVHSLARHWGFSKDGAVWHAKNCGLISSQIAEDLYHEHQVSERRWMSGFEGGRMDDACPTPDIRTDILDEVPPLWAGLGTEIIGRAYEAGVISVGRAREILGWH